MSDRVIDRLHREYQQSLEQKARELETLWSRDAPDRNALQKFLHRLAGSSGMYGFMDISDQARHLISVLGSQTAGDNAEQACRSLLSLMRTHSGCTESSHEP